MRPYARMLLGRRIGAGGLDTQYVTPGQSGTIVHNSRRIGFVDASFGAALGAIADGTSDLFADAPIIALYWDENGGSPDQTFFFAVSGIQANAGWTQMVINGTKTLLRADATFSNVSDTIWSWPAPVTIFPVGSVSTVVFS